MDRKRLWHFTILAAATISAAIAEQHAPNVRLADLSGAVFVVASLSLVGLFSEDIAHAIRAKRQKSRDRRQRRKERRAQRFPSLAPPAAEFDWDD
jgi:hypothetical protein